MEAHRSTPNGTQPQCSPYGGSTIGCKYGKSGRTTRRRRRGGDLTSPKVASSGFFKLQRGKNINILGETRQEVYLQLSSDSIQVLTRHKAF